MGERKLVLVLKRDSNVPVANVRCYAEGCARVSYVRHNNHRYHHHHVACPELDVAVSTSLLHACRFGRCIGLAHKNLIAEVSPVARWANAGKLGGQVPDG